MKEDINDLIKEYTKLSKKTTFILVYDKLEKHCKVCEKYNCDRGYLRELKNLLSSMYNPNLIKVHGYKKMIKFKPIFENFDKLDNFTFLKHFEKLDKDS